MKKKLSISASIMILVFAVILAACSSRNNDSQASQSSSATAASGQASKAPAASGKKLKIGTVVKVSGSEWFARMETGIKKFSGETGDETFLLGPPQADAAQQIKIIEDLIAQKVDAMFVVPISSEALEPVLKRARDQGIIVVTHEASGIQNADYDIEAFDNAKYGEHFMDKLAASMGEKGEYAIMVGSLTAKSHNEAADAAVALQKQKYPNMKLVGDRVESNDDQKVGYEKTKELLKAHPNLTGLLGFAMPDAAGMALAVEEMGLAGKVKIFGTSLVSVSGKFLNSSVNSISFWDPADVGYVGMKVIREIADGKKISDGQDLGVKGYNGIKLINGNVIQAKAWIDVNKDNMADYNF